MSRNLLTEVTQMMSQREFIFHGSVEPKRAQLSIPKIDIKFESDEGEFEVEFSVHLNLLIIRVSTTSSEDIYSLRNRLFALSNNIVKYIGFIHGLGYTVILDSCIDLLNRDIEVFGISGHHFSFAENEKKTFLYASMQGEKAQLKTDLLFDIYFCRALQELRNSIQYPDFTAMHCRFAIEAIRNSFGEKESEAWSQMRNTLRISRASLTKFNAVSANQKHGKNLPQSWEQRKQSMQIAWEVVYRYHLLKTDNNQLKTGPTLEDEFS